MFARSLYLLAFCALPTADISKWNHQPAKLRLTKSLILSSSRVGVVRYRDATACALVIVTGDSFSVRNLETYRSSSVEAFPEVPRNEWWWSHQGSKYVYAWQCLDSSTHQLQNSSSSHRCCMNV